MKNQELFDLCKQVYEATEWDGADAVYEQVVGIPEGEPYIVYPKIIKQYGLWGTQELKKRTPLYTSDYLLGKLPAVVQDPSDKIFRHIQMWVNGDGSAHAGYVEPYAHDDKVAYAQQSNEMRTALLKLALGLHKEGVL